MFTSRRHSPSLFLRVVAALLIPLLMITNPAALAELDSTVGGQKTNDASHPAPVLTPKSVKVNRRVPIVSAPSTQLTFSSNPTNQEIFHNSPFAEPLIPIGGKSTAAENKALAAALQTFFKRAVRDDFFSIEGFLSAYPNSTWNVALWNDLGSLYYQTGWYSKAMVAWQEAWKEGQGATGTGKTVADEALSKLINLNASVGRMDQVSKLTAIADKRKMQGSIKARVDRAEDGLATMKSNPGIAFRCGPLATEKMKNIADGNVHSLWHTMSMASTAEGTNMLQLKQLAKKLSISYQVAKRTPGSSIIVPSVINWKLGHFAAIVERKGDLIRLQDPTFGTDVWVSPQAIDGEGSGYFLVQQGALPTGWTSVDDKEAASVWGKGDNTNTNPNNTGPSSPTGGGSGGPPTPGPGDPAQPGQSPNPSTPPSSSSSPNPQCQGMASYFVSLQAASLIVQDTPLFYTPAYGPAINFQISYDQREAAQPAIFTYSNLGPLWTFNWLTYMVDDPANPGADLTQYLSGGGETTYTGYNSTTQTYASQSKTGVVVKLTGTSSYELDEPDGSVQIYNVATTTTPRKLFLSKTSDPSGNSLTFTYDSNYRLVSATDAAGLVTMVHYQNASNIYQITSVTDPYGRTATFSYTTEGYLQSSTDVSGIVSQYGYNGEGVTSLTTPYGTTTFSVGQNGNNRYVQATDPQGGQERFESWDNTCPYTPASEPLGAPTGFDNSYLNDRNTFYWSKKEMLVGAGNYGDATIYHWLHETNTATLSDVIESIRYPLESREYRGYPGQPADNVIGTSDQAIRAVRFMDDGSTQESDAQYNSLNNITQAIDPNFTQSTGTADHVTNYVYASNNIDLTEVHQGPTLPGDLVQSFTYYPNHLVHVATDASGQTTTYTYNSNNQISTVINAKNEMTTFGYTNGYLTSITGPQAGAAVSMTYDGFGRVQTLTDINGYTISFDYDNLNRITQITYPDGTTDQNVYTSLDITQSKDRQNRWTRYFYNSVEQLIAVMDPLDRITNFDRCTCGALKGIIDSKGNRTSWNQDIEGRIISKTFADNSQTTYAYENTTSRMKTVTDAKGQVATYTYNHDDSLQQVAYTNATVATPTTSFLYDLVYPRVTSMTDGTGTTSYNYNPVTATVGSGRLGYEIGPLGSTAQINYTYDQLERITGVAINGVSSSITYDSLGRITGSANALGSFGYAYYGVTPRLQTLTYPNGQSANYSYFGSSHDFLVSDITNDLTGTTVLSKFDYTYNPEGTISTVQQQTDSSTPTLWTYLYDKADQLESAVKTNTSTQAVLAQYVYNYDPAGNRKTAQIGLNVLSTTFSNLNQITGSSGGGPLQFTGSVNKPSTVTVGGNMATVDSNNNFSGSATVSTGNNTVAIVAANVNGNAATNNYQVVIPPNSSTTPTYDAEGNLTNNGNGQTYTWDALNELISITYTGGASTQFSYDGFGRRTAIVEKNSGGMVTSTKQYVWVGDEIAEERNAANAVQKRFFAFGEQQSGTAYFYSRDLLGSVREMTNSTNTIEARYDYDPYGQTTLIQGTNLSNFQYAGYYAHQPSGLNLTEYRAYNPNVGRWLSRDPLGEEADATLYSYVANDPVGAIDPLGLWQLTISGGLVIGGSLTFGNNGGSGWFNGNFNIGAQAGSTTGASITFDPNNSDPNAPNGVTNASGSISVNVSGSAKGGVGIASVTGKYSAGLKIGGGPGTGCPATVEVGATGSLSGNLGVKGVAGVGATEQGKAGITAPGMGNAFDPNIYSPYANGPTAKLPSYTLGGSITPFSIGIGYTF